MVKLVASDTDINNTDNKMDFDFSMKNLTAVSHINTGLAVLGSVNAMSMWNGRGLSNMNTNVMSFGIGYFSSLVLEPIIEKNVLPTLGIGESLM